jgi:hypothetical protein
VAPAIHRRVLAARIAWLGEELFAYTVGLNHLSVERRTQPPRQATLASAGRANEHD